MTIHSQRKLLQNTEAKAFVQLATNILPQCRPEDQRERKDLAELYVWERHIGRWPQKYGQFIGGPGRSVGLLNITYHWADRSQCL